MTSASELFCSRRSRVGRESKTAPDWGYSKHYLSSYDHQSDRIFGSGSNPISTRTSHSRMPGCLSVFPGQDQTEVEEGTTGCSPANNIIAGVSSIRIRPNITCSESERLPGAVVQAKQRLLLRLRGPAVSDRRSVINVNQRNYTSNSDFQPVGAVDWETDIVSGFYSEFDPFFFTHSKNPPGLSQEALNSLANEIFNSTNKGNDNNAIYWDCSICLERFGIGNKLTCLPCSHRFHQDCLSQWIQIHRDCPCCRSNVF